MLCVFIRLDEHTDAQTILNAASARMLRGSRIRCVYSERAVTVP